MKYEAGYVPYKKESVLSFLYESEENDMRKLYTAEAVTEGHPDKLCDQISDAIPDACLKQDEQSKVACEVLATKETIIVAGEITSNHGPDEETKIYINPSGRFVCGGLDTDTGLTGRKLMADSYGSMVPHGGGAFSGKDCSKVDRSAAYMARYIAKNIVAAGLAGKCQVSLAYVIGMAQPVMVQVDTLRLTRPIFRQTAAFGHFGRKEFPWERTDIK